MLWLFSLSALFLAFHMPNHYLPWVSFHAELMASISLLGFAFATVYSAKKQDRPLVVPRKAFWIVLIGVIPFAQWLFGLISFSGIALSNTLYLMGFALAYCVGYCLHTYKSDVLLVASQLFVFTAYVSIGIALYQWLRLSGLGIWVTDLAPGARPWANLNQPNHLASLILLGYVGWHYLYSRNAFNRSCYWIGALYFLFGLALTQSRTATITLILFAGFWCLRMGGFNKARDRFESGLQVLAYVFFFLIIVPKIGEWLWLDFSGRDLSNSEGGPEVRVLLWRNIVHAVADSPVFGYGWGHTTEAVLSAVPAFSSGREYAAYSHNLFLDLLVWNGLIIGGALIVAILCWAGKRLLAANSLEVNFALAYIGVVAVHSMLEYPYAYAYFLLPTAFFAGVVDTQFVRRVVYLPKRIAAFVLGAGGVLLVSLTMEYMQMEDNMRRVRFEIAQNRVIPQMSSYKEAFFFNQLSERVRFHRTVVADTMTSEDLAWMYQVTRYDAGLGLLVKYVEALALNGMEVEAATEMNLIFHLYGQERYALAKAEVIRRIEQSPERLAALLQELPEGQ